MLRFALALQDRGRKRSNVVYSVVMALLFCSDSPDIDSLHFVSKLGTAKQACCEFVVGTQC